MLALYAQLLLLVALPLAIAVCGAAIAWRSFAHPWLFLASAVVVLYLVYALIMYFLDPNLGKGGTGYMVSARPNPLPGESKYMARTMRGEELTYFLSEYVKRLLSFVVLSAPVLWGLSKLFQR